MCRSVTVTYGLTGDALAETAGNWIKVSEMKALVG
jgi:hypothetical protein